MAVFVTCSHISLFGSHLMVYLNHHLSHTIRAEGEDLLKMTVF